MFLNAFQTRIISIVTENKQYEKKVKNYEINILNFLLLKVHTTKKHRYVGIKYLEEN